MKTTLETLVPEKGREILIYERRPSGGTTTLEISSHQGDERFEPTPFIVEIEDGRETHSIHLDRERARDLVEWLQKALEEAGQST